MAAVDTQHRPDKAVPARRPLEFISWAVAQHGRACGGGRAVVGCSQRELTLAWGRAASQGTIAWYLAQLRQRGVVVGTRPLLVDLAALDAARSGAARPTNDAPEAVLNGAEEQPTPRPPGGGGGGGDHHRSTLAELLAEQTVLVAQMARLLADAMDLQARILASSGRGAVHEPLAEVASGVADVASPIAETASTRGSRDPQAEGSEVVVLPGQDRGSPTFLPGPTREPSREPTRGSRTPDARESGVPVLSPARVAGLVEPLVRLCRVTGRADHLDERGRAVLGRFDADRLAHGVGRMQREATADTRITSPLGLLVAKARSDPAYFEPPTAPAPVLLVVDEPAHRCPPEVEAAAAALEDDPGRAQELAALDAEVRAFLGAGRMPARTVARLMETEEGRRAQRRAWWAKRGERG